MLEMATPGKRGLLFYMGKVFLKVVPPCFFSILYSLIQVFGWMIHLKEYGNKLVKLIGNYYNLNL